MRHTGNRKQATGNSGRRLRRLAGLGAIASTVLLLAGCRQDMHNQPKFYPQRGSEFYPDGRSARPQVENTIARNQLRRDAYFFTGFDGGKEGDGMPFPVTEAVIHRGQERYNVFCTPCHSRVGNGAGMIVQRGYAAAGNFHTDRLRSAPLGHFFNVIANGYGAMPDYAAQLSPEERWAVVAYVRALQLSQAATQADVAEGGHVQTLDALAGQEGFASGFAYDWGLPGTAVKGTPNGQDFAIPTGVMNGPNGGPPSATGAPTPSRQGGQAAGTGSSEAGVFGRDIYPNPVQQTAGANTDTSKQ